MFPMLSVCPHKKQHMSQSRNAACLQPFHLKSYASDSSIWHSSNEDEIEQAEEVGGKNPVMVKTEM